MRLYHDNALSKEPGAGRTPWHYDAHHFPLDSPDVLTAWIPLQPTPRERGPLAFARGADTWRLVADVEFDKHGTSYDRRVSETFRDRGVVVEARSVRRRRDQLPLGQLLPHRGRQPHHNRADGTGDDILPRRGAGSTGPHHDQR